LKAAQQLIAQERFLASGGCIWRSENEEILWTRATSKNRSAIYPRWWPDPADVPPSVEIRGGVLNSHTL